MYEFVVVSFILFFLTWVRKIQGKLNVPSASVLCSCKHGLSWGSLHLSKEAFVFWGGSVGRLDMAHCSRLDVKQQQSKKKNPKPCWLLTIVHYYILPGLSVGSWQHINMSLLFTDYGNFAGTARALKLILSRFSRTAFILTRDWSIWDKV